MTAPSQATAGYPVQIQLGSATVENSPSWSTITEVKDAAGPEEMVDIDDVTNHDSPNGREEVIPTILRSGNVAIPCNYVPSSATQDGTTGLKYLLRNRIKRGFRVINSDVHQTYVQFDAYVEKFAPKWPVKGAVLADFQLKPTGDYTEGTLA